MWTKHFVQRNELNGERGGGGRMEQTGVTIPRSDFHWRDFKVMRIRNLTLNPDIIEEIKTCGGASTLLFNTYGATLSALLLHLYWKSRAINKLMRLGCIQWLGLQGNGEKEERSCGRKKQLKNKKITEYKSVSFPCIHTRVYSKKLNIQKEVQQ